MNNAEHRPLADRVRPLTLSEYVGQEHIIGENAPLGKAIANGIIPSILLWGPPGVGKTTLAQLISNHLDRPFYTLSAINSGVKDIREVIDKVKNQGLFGGANAILFIDEIHRFSKSQQDSLLAAVEKGIITLIGATTENPSFEVIAALLSRCQVYVLKHHTVAELNTILNRAITKDTILKEKNLNIEENEALFRMSGGDARKLLNALEIVANNTEDGLINDEVVLNTIQQNIALYDKSGEQHYDIISAFIKSIRGSDPNAAVYWLARMVEGGEDPKFIARRLLVFASEDIGNTNPTALIMANNCFQAVNVIGWPESRIILSQCVLYLASSAKSNSAYQAINQAQKLVQSTGNLPVPIPLRNAPTTLMKELGYGKEYLYSHDHTEKLGDQEFLPEEIKGTRLFEPANTKRELELRGFLKSIWKEKYGY
ncbi:replication-associated recombination protein A [Flavobacteriales bacterium]|nr:replication-associated recombination protein A [Flavobacteriales bacterium]